MSSALIIAGSVVAGIAALIHVLIFGMESVAWSSPGVWRRFGLRSQQYADTVRPMAFNQGFYNLFLAVVAAAGIVAFLMGHKGVGAALVFAGVGSMLAAAAVLLASSPDKSRAALTQGTLPLVGVVLLGIALTTT